MKAYLEKNGSSWWVWLPADNPHGRVLVRKFHTKRSALAAARMIDAREINVADAEIIIADDVRRGPCTRAQETEFFVIHFGGNFGLAKPAGWDEAFGRKEGVEP